jgi:hypothetical protein
MHNIPFSFTLTKYQTPSYIQIHVQGMVNNIVLVKKLPTYKQNLLTGPTTFTI